MDQRHMLPMQSPARKRLALAPMNSPLTPHLSPMRGARRRGGGVAIRRSGPLFRERLVGPAKAATAAAAGAPARSKSVYIFQDGGEEDSDENTENVGNKLDEDDTDSTRGAAGGVKQETAECAGEEQHEPHGVGTEQEAGDFTPALSALSRDTFPARVPGTIEMNRDPDMQDRGNNNNNGSGDDDDDDVIEDDTPATTTTTTTTTAPSLDSQRDATKQCLLTSATLTKRGCIFCGQMCKFFGDFAAEKCTMPTYCLINCPASVLFCCTKEDAPDFPHVSVWVKRDDARVIHCQGLKRHYRKAKRGAYVWIKQTCFGVRPEAQVLSREDRLFEERRIAKLEAQKSKRLARASMIAERAKAKNGPVQDPFASDKDLAPPVFRAPPVRSNRNALSAMDRAIITRKAKDRAASGAAGAKTTLPKSRPSIQNDRFAMVEHALEKQCYTTDGKRFFRSKRQLDAHFSRMRVVKPVPAGSSTMAGKGKNRTSSGRPALQPIDENSKPLAQRNIRKLVEARFHKTKEPTETEGEQRLRERNAKNAMVGVFTGESLAGLQRNGKSPRRGKKSRKKKNKNKQEDDGEDDGGGDVASQLRKHEIYTDLQEVRIAQFQKGLNIFDELYAPGTLRAYLMGVDRNYEERTGRVGEFEHSIERIEEETDDEAEGKDTSDGEGGWGVRQESSDDDGDKGEGGEKEGDGARPQKNTVGDDWMCAECGFANSLDLETCQICEAARPKEQIDEFEIPQRIAEAPWSVARRRPFQRKFTKKVRKRMRKQRREARERLKNEREAAAKASAENDAEAAVAAAGKIFVPVVSSSESDEETRRQIVIDRARADADLRAAEVRAAKLKRETPPVATMIPFNKIVEIVAKAEDIRGVKFTTRDTFVNFNRVSGEGMGDIAFAIASFFTFGKIVQFVVNETDAEAMNKTWRETKSILDLRKSLASGGSGSGASSKNDAENANPMMKSKKQRKQKKRKKNKQAQTSVESCVASWENYARIDEASVCFLNLTGVPEAHQRYPNRPLSSDRWRPTLKDAVGAVEDRLSLLNEGSMFILATRDELYVEKDVGWEEKEGEQVNQDEEGRHGDTSRPSSAKTISRPGTAASRQSRPGTAVSSRSSRSFRSDGSGGGVESDHPIEIVGWRRVETARHRHRGLVHEDADVDGIVPDSVTGQAAFWCESDVNDGVWVRIDVFLREDEEEDKDAFLALMDGM
jgi:hypothetical protein